MTNKTTQQIREEILYLCCNGYLKDLNKDELNIILKILKK